MSRRKEACNFPEEHRELQTLHPLPFPSRGKLSDFGQLHALCHDVSEVFPSLQSNRINAFCYHFHFLKLPALAKWLATGSAGTSRFHCRTCAVKQSGNLHSHPGSSLKPYKVYAQRGHVICVCCSCVSPCAHALDSLLKLEMPAPCSFHAFPQARTPSLPH